MKKIIMSASLVALGAASVQSATPAGLQVAQTSKPWSVSATLRGFYDDNTTTVHKSIGELDSYGFEVSPSAALNLMMEQTTIGLSYVYGMRYFEARSNNRADHTHQANAKLSHAFTERYKLDVSDSFVVAQEPEVIDPQVITRFLRSEGNNIRNTAAATFTAGLTENLGAVVGYSNSIYDYEQTGPGSRSALLDRVEHLASLNLRWQVLPNTVGILGYQFGIVDYTSNDPLTALPAVLPALNDTEIRNNYSHYIYVGVDQNFTAQLSGALRAGAQITVYDNAPAPMTQDSASPYVDASATWTYQPQSYVQLGVRHSRNQTDVAFLDATNPTLDAESTAVYGSLNHQITAKLTGSMLATFQNSSYEGGFADGRSDNFLLLGANVSYDITEFLAAEAGYNYDRLDSDLPVRSYTRNRFYIGIRATY